MLVRSFVPSITVSVAVPVSCSKCFTLIKNDYLHSFYVLNVTLSLEESLIIMTMSLKLNR